MGQFAVTTTIPAGRTGEATAVCDHGVATGGGGYFTGAPDQIAGLVQTNPVTTTQQQPNAWHAAAYNNSSAPLSFTVYAVCVHWLHV